MVSKTSALFLRRLVMNTAPRAALAPPRSQCHEYIRRDLLRQYLRPLVDSAASSQEESNIPSRIGGLRLNVRSFSVRGWRVKASGLSFRVYGFWVIGV